jgi:hypothetical protein
MEQLEKFFEDLFLKKITYQLPPKGKEFLVQIAPYLAIIGVIMMVPAILAILGMGSFFSAYSYGFGLRLGWYYYIGIIFIIIQTVLMAMSIQGLMKRKKQGWRFLYYSSLVSLVHSVAFAFNPMGVIWALIGSAIGLYLLFQIKSHYA